MLDFITNPIVMIVIGLALVFLGGLIGKWLNKNPKAKKIAQPISDFLDLFTDKWRELSPENRTIKDVDKLLDKLIKASGLYDLDDQDRAKEIAHKIASSPQIK